MKPFLVIPTFNESDNLENLVEQIYTLHPDFHIIIVDDNLIVAKTDTAKTLPKPSKCGFL
jgi:glycosyltransferase involved in cell wall biosynthesis